MPKLNAIIKENDIIIGKVTSLKSDLHGYAYRDSSTTHKNAEDCRIVLLSGTPIINYPHEMAVTFNLLRGYIKTWMFKVVVSTNKEINQKVIINHTIFLIC